jgi:hypothetical protein
VGAKDRARRLEQAIRSELSGFPLLDGRTHFYSEESHGALYLFFYDCLEAGNPDSWPEPPEVLLKLCEAKDVRVAFEAVMGGSPSGATGSFLYDDIFPYDAEVLINERRLEPRSVVAGRNLGEEVPDLSE